MEEEEDNSSRAPAAAVGEWTDMLNTGAVMKQIVRAAPKQNLEAGTPDFKQQVLVHAVGRTLGPGPTRVFQNTREDNRPISLYVGEPIMDMLPPGVMLCLRSMHVGEIARVKLESRYAFGLGGSWFGLAPNTDVEYEIELLQLGDLMKEVAEQSLEELKQTMREFKDRGNEFFKWNEYNKALRCYKEGVRFGDGLFGDTGVALEEQEFDQEAYRDRVSCISNIAATYEKLGQNKEAMESTVLALQADPSHLKSLARAVRIAVRQGSHEEALAAIQVALDLAPTNPAILKLKHELDLKIAEHAALERQRYGGFLKPVSKEVSAKLKEERERALIETRELEAAAEQFKLDARSKEEEEESTPLQADADAEEEEELDEEVADVVPIPATTSFENNILWRLFVLLFPTLFVLLAILVPKLMSKAS